MLHLRVLGPLRLEGDGSPLAAFAARRLPLGLLAFLASHGRQGVSRDKLLAYFWPESDTRHARNSLKQAIFGLRRLLGEEALETAGPLVYLKPGSITVDLWEFEEALARGVDSIAVGLYDGPYLDGFYLEERSEFERWVEGERQRLASRYGAAVRSLALRTEADGDLAAAGLWWRRLAAAEPLSATAALGLMRVLAASGDRAEALDHAQAYGEAVRAELGIEVDPAVTAFVEQLRAAAPASESRISPETEEAPLRQPGSAVGQRRRRELRWATPVGSWVPPAAAAPLPAAVRSTPARRVTWAYLVIALALSFGVISLGTRGTRDAAELTHAPSTVTVLPFTTTGGPEAAALASGLQDLLAAGMDGLDGLRTVPLAGRGSKQSSAGSSPSAIASRSGARLYVTGRLIRSEGRLRATASLWDRANADHEVGRVQAEVEGDALFDLVDQLVDGLVADRYSDPGERLVRTAAATTRSLPALKAYLEGERQLRQDDYTDAIDAFRMAVRADTAFAMAYYRLSVTSDRTGDGRTAMWAASLAARFSERLSEHDRRLVTANLNERKGLLDEAERLYRRLVADYPEDSEAWFRLGEVLFHGNPLRGRSSTEARVAFERVLALDPEHADAMVYLARLASIEGYPSEVDLLIHRAIAATGDSATLALRVIRAFELSDRPGQGPAMRDLLARPERIPSWAALEAAVHADDVTGTERFAELLLRADGNCDVRGLGHRMLAQVELAGGRLRAAASQFGLAQACDPSAAVELQVLASVQPFMPAWSWEPRDLRRMLDDPMLQLDPALRHYYSGLVALQAEDTTAAARDARSLTKGVDTTAAGQLGRTLGHSLQARLAVARGRRRDALTLLEGARWEQVADRSPAEVADRYLRAELLRQLGRSDEAVGWYASIAQRASYELVYLAPAELRLAQIYDYRGDWSAALGHYRRFVQLWRDADPELRLRVVEAQTRIAELERVGQN